MSRRRGRPRPPSGDGGMVLIVVLWMVAALSILVTGMTRSVREEAHVLSQARQRVEGGALGEAVIQLVLQEMAATTKPVVSLATVDVVYRGVKIQVQVMPLNGLVDINNASAALLTRLYAVGAGVSADAAAALAQATLDTRLRKDGNGIAERLDAKEDLLRVPGIDYTLYAKIAPLVTADLKSDGKVNPLAAPAEVLVVLAGGDTGVATRIASERTAGREGIDTTALDGESAVGAPTQRFRVDARVPLPSGAWLHVSRSVDFNVNGRDGLPWRTFLTERSFEAVPAKSS